MHRTRNTLILSLLLLAATSAPAASTDTLVVLNKEGASAWLVDPVSGETRARVKVGDGPHEAAVSPDGRTAVACNYGARGGGETLTVIDIPSGRAVRTIDLSPHGSPHGIQYLPDGRHVLVTSEKDGRLVKVDVARGTVVAAFDAGGNPHMVAVEPSGRLAWATSIGSGSLSVIDLQDPSVPPRTVVTGRGTEALALLPSRGEVWVGNNSEHVVRIVDAATLAVTGEIEVGLQPIRLAADARGEVVLATCILSGDLAVIDAATRKVIRRVGLSRTWLRESQWKDRPVEEIRPLVQKVVQEGARPIGVLFAPDSRTAYVANRGLDHVAVVDLATWAVVRRLPAGKGPDGMAWSRIEE